MSYLCGEPSLGFPHFIFVMEVLTISTKENLINEEIKLPEVRVVGNDGEMLGVFKIAKALELAAEKDLDLVLLSPGAVPPVCKIMDYGKFCFEKEKRAKEAKKKQQVVDIKEIQLSCTIGEHDFQTKLNHAHRFLKGGDKVKVVVRFRGREMRHTELGAEILAKFEKGCEGIGAAEKKAVLDGRNMTMFISPVKQ
jgi:translation initiation factor IF-3